MPSPAEHREQAAFDQRMAERDELRELRAQRDELARHNGSLIMDAVEREKEIERLRQHDKLATDLTIDQQAEIGRLRAEVERLLVDSAELSAECDQWVEKLAEVWIEVAELRAEVAARDQ